MAKKTPADVKALTTVDPSSVVIELSKQPISQVVWRLYTELHSNDYNPNKVFAPELALLKLSLLEDGWTQAIVIHENGEIVDGFHRWTLASTDKAVQAMTGGMVPTVVTRHTHRVDQMASTVRHNRARGQHGILKMGAIVQTAVAQGLSEESICTKFGMELEEVERLNDVRSSPDMAGKDSFGRGWVPST